jgi:hypothetical protein
MHGSVETARMDSRSAEYKGDGENCLSPMAGSANSLPGQADSVNIISVTIV